jgi:hypothetical protein
LPDINNYTLKIQGLVALGIPELLNPDRQFTLQDPDLAALQRMACLCSQHIKRAIGLNLSLDGKSAKQDSSWGVRVTFYRENLPALIFCWCC